ERADVNHAVDAVFQAGIHHVAGAPDGAAIEFHAATFHGGSDVVDDLDALHGPVDRGRFAEVACHDVKVLVGRGVFRRAALQDANRVAALAQAAQHGAAQEAGRAGQQNARLFAGRDDGEGANLIRVGTSRGLREEGHDAPGTLGRDRGRRAVAQSVIETGNVNADAGVGLQAAGGKFERVQRDVPHVARRRFARVDHAGDRHGRGHGFANAEQRNVAIDIEITFGAVNDQLVLNGLVVPAHVDAGAALFTFSVDAPFVEVQQRQAAGGLVMHFHLTHIAQKSFEQVERVHAEILQGIRTVPVRGGQRATFESGIGRAAQNIDREYVANGALGYEVERAQDHGIEAVGVIDGDNTAIFTGGGDDAVAILHGLGHGLFDKYVAAAAHGRDREVGVECRRSKDVN